MIKNSKQAKEQIKDTNSEHFDKCGKCAEAKGFLDCLKYSEEVLSLVMIVEAMRMTWKHGDQKFSEKVDEALSKYRESVGEIKREIK